MLPADFYAGPVLPRSNQANSLIYGAQPVENAVSAAQTRQESAITQSVISFESEESEEPFLDLPEDLFEATAMRDISDETIYNSVDERTPAFLGDSSQNYVRELQASFDEGSQSSFAQYSGSLTAQEYQSSFDQSSQSPSAHYSGSFCTQDYQSSFEQDSQTSFAHYSGAFSAQDDQNSFASQSGYGNVSRRNHAAGSFDFIEPRAAGLHQFEESGMAGDPAGSSLFDLENSNLDPEDALGAVLTEANMQAFDFMSQNIRAALETGLTKQHLLEAKIEGLKQELDGPKNPTAAPMPERVPREKLARRGPVHKVAGRRTPKIKPPRIDPYKTDQEHGRAITEYQAEFKKRHKLKGYETLLPFTEANVNRLMEMNLAFNQTETAFSNYLEDRVEANEIRQLLGIEWFMASVKKDLEEIWGCFAQLENIGLGKAD